MKYHPKTRSIEALFIPDAEPKTLRRLQRFVGCPTLPKTFKYKNSIEISISLADELDTVIFCAPEEYLVKCGTSFYRESWLQFNDKYERCDDDYCLH